MLLIIPRPLWPGPGPWLHTPASAGEARGETVTALESPRIRPENLSGAGYYWFSFISGQLIKMCVGCHHLHHHPANYQLPAPSIRLTIGWKYHFHTQDCSTILHIFVWFIPFMSTANRKYFITSDMVTWHLIISAPPVINMSHRDEEFKIFPV